MRELAPGAVAELQRPRWAQTWAVDRDGLHALTPPLGHWAHRVAWRPDTVLDPEHPEVPTTHGEVRFRRLSHADSGLAVHLGADLRAGLFVDLDIGGATQRLRWLPPGEFWMGSPPDEPGRYKNEGPRHRVRLTEGFWLADTACTQALWLAVMGGQNPSGFTGDDQRPVEQVSWDDVQAFLGALQALLPPGCEAVLPTEAQWEYACRAGTDTAFNTGATLDRMLANFDAANDTPLAPRGEKSKATVPVKSLPPNAWGLYEMHGNVWEWCADMWRPFGGITDPDEPVENPIGPQEPGPKAPLAVRGGSWVIPAWYARSACRNGSARGHRSDRLGFRFALRSTSPAGPEGPPVASGPEGRPRSSGPEGPPAVAAPRGAPPARPEAERRGVFGQAAQWLADRVKSKPKPKPKPASGKPPRKP